MYLEIKELNKSFGQHQVLKDINFSAEKGQFITLLGASGCGKSTLLRAIAGLTPIDSGSITINQRETQAIKIQQRNIGMVFQHYALFPNMTALDNILFGLKIKKIPTEEQHQRAKAIIDIVALNGREQHYPHQLSGGQKQRVALARSLITNPDILLLDEPFSALDAQIRKSLRQQVREITQTLNLTTLFVTHDQKEALTLSDHIILMHNGKIAQQGSPQDIYTQPQTPFAANFIGNYNVLDAHSAETLFGIAQAVAIRPEAIRFDAPNLADKTLAGNIVSMSLQGNIINYQVEIKEHIILNVEVLNTEERPFTNQTAVELFIPDSAIQRLRPDTESSL